MEIKINLNIFAFIAIFYLTGQLKIYALLMFFAFLHECGHLFAGILLKFSPKSLKIMPLGLSVIFNIFPEEYNKKILNTNILTFKKLIIAISGPMVNAIIIIVTFFFQGKINNIIYSNLLLIILNLIPIYPLDGGRILKYILNIIYGIKKSITYTNKISNIILVIITILSSISIYCYKNIAIFFIIIYLWGIQILENKRYNMKLHIYELMEKN